MNIILGIFVIGGLLVCVVFCAAAVAMILPDIIDGLEVDKGEKKGEEKKQRGKIKC